MTTLQSPNLHLPYLAAAQAQKHVTHNEALRRLDALVQLSVATRTIAVPPTTPSDGARFIVSAGASGAWSGHDHAIAAWQDGAWTFLSPSEGWTAWIADEDQLFAWNGSIWTPAAPGASLNPAPLVGINAIADETNRLSVASPASLFNHAGAGHQLKINKAASAQTASALYQTGFSGRAEIGLSGDDNLHVKVSSDGILWREAMTIDRSTGISTLRALDSQQVMIAQDAVAVITAPSAGGLVTISNVHPNFPQASMSGIFSYDVGSTPALVSLAVGAGMSNLGTVTPTGTTGAANKANVAANASGQILIENRFTSATPQQYSITFIGGYRAIS